MTKPTRETFDFRCVTVRDARYIRVEDVAAYLRKLAETEETDTRNRLLKAAEYFR